MKFHNILAVRPRDAGSVLVGAMVIALSVPFAACSTSSSLPGVANVGSTPTSSQSASSSGNGTSGGSQSGTGAITVAFSQCMRSHGEAKFPDPNSQGSVSVLQAGINPNTPQFQAAEKACAYLENGPQAASVPPSQSQAQALKFSTCMRSHGYPTFPDPSSNGQISFNSGDGIDPTSPQFKTAQTTCSQQSGFGKNAKLGSGA
jgi:hypothetical protein